MKYAYNRVRRVLVRDEYCLGMRCFNPQRLIVEHHKPHSIVGNKAFFGGKRVYKICKTLYDNDWECPKEERFDVTLNFERMEAGWKIKEF